MNNRLKWFIVLATMFTLAACGTSETPATSSGGADQTLATKQQITDGDFIYRLVTEKGEYGQEEAVNLYAELEYVGEEDSIVIYHAASPFYFDLYEKTRDYSITYAMIQPLLETTLKKGEPLREAYQKSGGYSEDDDKEYIQFMEEFLKGDHYPTGEYEVEGRADFFIHLNDEEIKSYTIEAKVGFQVK